MLRSNQIRSLKLCRRRPEAMINGERVPITWQTWQLLNFLLDAPGVPLSNDQLCDRFRLDLDKDGCNEQMLQIVHRSRKILARVGYPDLIETVPGDGYRLRIAR